MFRTIFNTKMLRQFKIRNVVETFVQYINKSLVHKKYNCILSKKYFVSFNRNCSVLIKLYNLEAYLTV